MLYVSNITASNYSGSNNDAAIMIIEINSTNALARPIDSQKQLTNLTYFVHHFKTSSADSGNLRWISRIGADWLYYNCLRRQLYSSQLSFHQVDLYYIDDHWSRCDEEVQSDLIEGASA